MNKFKLKSLKNILAKLLIYKLFVIDLQELNSIKLKVYAIFITFAYINLLQRNNYKIKQEHNMVVLACYKTEFTTYLFKSFKL